MKFLVTISCTSTALKHAQVPVTTTLNNSQLKYNQVCANQFKQSDQYNIYNNFDLKYTLQTHNLYNIYLVYPCITIISYKTWYLIYA